MWLVAGLGNPGERYANTRHNLGTMVVERLASEAGVRLRKVRFIPVLAAEIRFEDQSALLAHSLRFMNESGPSFASLATKRGIEPDHIVAVHDEIDLGVGSLRLKFGGSSAGHNGLKSLEGALRTPGFCRVRLGVGRPPGRQDPADFVLEPIRKKDEPSILALVDDGSEAVRALVTEGLERAQDRHNRTGPRGTEP
jgi:PTH1 family peptidyl-tRNA hydrolase